MNIVDAFLYQARLQPTALALCTPGLHYRTVSYGRLAHFVNNVGCRATAAGLKRGEVVAIGTGDPVLHLALVLGLTRIGVVTLSIGDRGPPSDLAIDAVISERHVAGAARAFPADTEWIAGPGDPPRIEFDFEAAAARPPARIILTSGTTGDPKAVALSHDLMARRLQAYDAAFGATVPSCSRFFLDLGLTASLGYALTMYILSRGGAIFLRGADPAETMQAFDLYKVQCMTAAPTGVAEFLDYYERSPDFACPFSVVMASGGLLSRALSERVRTRMCSNVIATYGATEISPVAAAPAHRIADIKGAAGFVAPWVQAQAVDDNDRPLGPGVEGFIRLRGHTCFDGYLGNPRDAHLFFRHGWFYPGDIGSIMDDRMLVLSGRQQAVINVGGNKVNPETIEAVLESFPGIIHSAAFGRPNEVGVDQVWAIVTAGDDVDLGAVRAHCARLLPAQFVPVSVLRVANMPFNAMGRLDRKSLPALAPVTPGVS